MTPLLLLTFLISVATAGAAAIEPFRGPSPTRFLDGDAAYRERTVPERAKAAMLLFRKTFSEAPTDIEAGWRLSMACHFVGRRLTTVSDERAALFAEGRDAGLAAAALDPACAACHFWAAINMALYGEEVGPLKMLASLEDIKVHLRASIAVDPHYAYGGAYRVLGLIYQKLPGILGGDNEKARQNFELAIQAAPDEPMNYVFLAKLLSEEMDRPDDSLKVARVGLSVGPPSSDRIESIEAWKELELLIPTPPIPAP